jgi:hypothetical protein
MKSSPRPPIPVPSSQRLRELRFHLVPVMVIAVCIAILVVLWRENICSPLSAGLSEPSEFKARSGNLVDLDVASEQWDVWFC